MDANPISIKDIYNLKRIKDASSETDEFHLAAVLMADLTWSGLQRKNDASDHRAGFSEKFRKSAAAAITAETGRIFNSIGETLLAVFTDPVKSINSGVFLIRKFNETIEGDSAYKFVHLKIVIHYGSVHIEGENQEAIGSAVSYCNSVLPDVPSGNVWITEPLRRQIENELNELNFKIVSVSTGREALDTDIPLYKLIFDGMLDDDEKKSDHLTNLLMIPLFYLGTERFRRLWKKIQNDADHFHHPSVLRRDFEAEAFIRFDISDAENAAAVSLDIRKQLIDFYASELDTLFIPLAIVICTPSELDAHSPFDRIFDPERQIVPEPETIYISSQAAAYLDKTWNIASLSNTGGPQTKQHAFFRLNSIDSNQNRETGLFNYRHTLLKGAYDSCFFCGGNDHPARDCPSKRLETASYEAIQSLSRQDVKQISELWLTELYRSAYSTSSTEHLNNPVYRSVFDVQLVFQRRFCQSVWSSDQNNWDEFRKGNAHTRKHPANACFNADGIDEIESRIEAAMHHYPYNFGLYCALGLVGVETGDTEKALQNFRQSLVFAETGPQKALVHLLIFRIFEMNGDFLIAEKELTSALNAVHHCPEAQYFRIRLLFRKDMKGKAGADLETLVNNYPEFFTIALLDPSLPLYNRHDQTELKYVLDLAAQELEEKNETVMALIKNVETLMKSSDTIREFNQEVSRIKNYFQGVQSFFRYHEASRMADGLIDKIQRHKEDQKRLILRSLNEIIDKCAVRMIKMDAIAFPEKLEPVQSDLQHLQTNFVNAKFMVLTEKPNSFSNALELIEQHSPAFDGIDQSLDEQEVKGKLYEFGVAFIKIYCIIQAVNCFIAMILFPVIVHFILSSFPNLSIPADLIPFYTKMVLIFGAIGGLGISAVIALIKTYPDKQ